VSVLPPLPAADPHVRPFTTALCSRSLRERSALCRTSEAAGVTVKELQERRIVQDDRVEFTITDSAVLFGSPTRGSGW